MQVLMCLSLCCSLMLWNFAETDRLLSLVPFCRWWAWIYTKPTQVYASYILSLKITVRHCECGVQSRLIYVCYNIVENRTALFKESWWDPYTLYPIFHFPRSADEEKKVSWTKTVCKQKAVEASSPVSLTSHVSIIPSLTTQVSRAFYLILSSMCAFTSYASSRLQPLLSPCTLFSRLQLVSFLHRELSSRNTSAKSFLTFPSHCHKIFSCPIILHFLDRTFHVCIYQLSIWTPWMSWLFQWVQNRGRGGASPASEQVVVSHVLLVFIPGNQDWHKQY